MRSSIDARLVVKEVAMEDPCERCAPAMKHHILMRSIHGKFRRHEHIALQEDMTDEELRYIFAYGGMDFSPFPTDLRARAAETLQARNR